MSICTGRNTSEFLGLQIYNHLNWKRHIYFIPPELSATYSAVRSLLCVASKELQKTV